MPDADTPENRLSMAYGKCQQAEELLALAQQHQSNPGLIKQAIDLYIEVMSMEDVERWLGPILNYTPARVAAE